MLEFVCRHISFSALPIELAGPLIASILVFVLTVIRNFITGHVGHLMRVENNTGKLQLSI